MKSPFLFNNIEMPLVEVLASMERTGVILDKESLKTVAEDMKRYNHFGTGDLSDRRGGVQYLFS